METGKSTNTSVIIIALIILALVVVAIIYFASNRDQQNGGQDTNLPTIAITVVPGTLVPQLGEGTPAAYFYQPDTQ